VDRRDLLRSSLLFFYFVGGLLYVCGSGYFLGDDLMLDYIYLSIIGATAALLLGVDSNEF